VNEVLWILVGLVVGCAAVATLLLPMLKRANKTMLDARAMFEKQLEDMGAASSRSDEAHDQHLTKVSTEAEGRLRQVIADWQGKLAIQQAEQKVLHSETLKDIEQQWQQRLNAKQLQIDELRMQLHVTATKHAEEMIQKVRYYEQLAHQEGNARREHVETAYLKGGEERAKRFRVEVRPFVEKYTDKGMFKCDYWYKAGYQYQLFVNNVPCFEPHRVVERQDRFKEFSEEKLKTYVDLACKIVDTLQSSQLENDGLPFTYGENPIVVESA
jgi:hypothetical protein